MFRIQTFTGRHDPVEDRLRLDAVDAAGGKQTIFLTRRLSDRLIPVLVSHLEGKTPEGVPADLEQGMSQSRVRQVRQTIILTSDQQILRLGMPVARADHLVIAANLPLAWERVLAAKADVTELPGPIALPEDLIAGLLQQIGGRATA